MKVLIAFERSGVIRTAFRIYGHDAYSNDLVAAADGSKHHIIGDAREVVTSQDWDLVIAHPPCQYLSSSGLHWNKRPEGIAIGRDKLTAAALELARFFFNLSKIDRVAIENPVGRIGTAIRKADQWIQPFEFGHPESKNTGLWLKGLPLLTPTNILPLPLCGYWANQTPGHQNKLPPSDDREHIRAKTYEGIALAMAIQWGGDYQREEPARRAKTPAANVTRERLRQTGLFASDGPPHSFTPGVIGGPCTICGEAQTDSLFSTCLPPVIGGRELPKLTGQEHAAVGAFIESRRPCRLCGDPLADCLCPVAT